MTERDIDLAFTSLAGLLSLSTVLTDLPLPSPSLSSLSSLSLLYEPRLSEEAHSWLSSEDDNLVHSLTIAMASTNTDNIEFKESYANDDVDHNALPPLFKAIINHNEDTFKNKRGFSGIFKQPSYLNWDNNYDQQMHFNYGFNSTAYHLSDIMTPSPEQPKDHMIKDSTDSTLEELHEAFPEYKFSSDSMHIRNKVPLNIANLSCNIKSNSVTGDTTIIPEKQEKKKKKKKKKHKDSKHSKDENGQYSILKSNPDSQKLVLSLIKSPEDQRKSKKKKKKREKDKDRKRLKCDKEPIKKIKLNIKLSNNGDNAQIISSTFQLDNLILEAPKVQPNESEFIYEQKTVTTTKHSTLFTNILSQELSPSSSKQCVTLTSTGAGTPSTALDRISQCSTSSLIIPSSQEPDHHMWNYPILSNKVDDQFDLSIPIDISGNNFSDFMTGDDLLSPLNLNMANTSMLNSVLRESVNEPFLIDDFDNNSIDMRSNSREPSGLAIYLTNGSKDNDILINEKAASKFHNNNENDSSSKHIYRRNKRRKNELDGLKTWFVGTNILKEPVIELTDIAVCNESTWDKTLGSFSQTYKEKAMKRKRNSRNNTQNSAFVFENDDDYKEATNPSNNLADLDVNSDISKRGSRNMNMTYVGMDEGEDGEDISQRAKRRKKDDDEPFEMKLKDSNEIKYLPLKKSQENIRKRRERVPGLTKLSNTNSKSQLPSDMLDPSLITESSTYQHFISLIDSCLEDVEQFDLIKTMKDQSESDIPIPSDVLLSRENLQEMCNEIAKLKATCSTKDVPFDKLSKINTLLMLNICSGAKICLNMPENDNDDVQNRNFRDYAIEKIGQSLDASFVAMNIMTSSEMSKEVFIEDVIESVVNCVKYQLTNLIFPEYDAAYRVMNSAKENQMSIKWKRAREKESTKSKCIIYFYNRLVDIISNLSELVVVQTLTDNVILQLSSLGVSVFFVENINDLQLVSLRLITTIFSKYEKHRDLIIEDILASLSRLPSSKKNLRNYRLNSEDSIQMLTALSLLLVQSVVNTSDLEKVDDPSEAETGSSEKPISIDVVKIDKESLIESSYSKAKEISYKILRIFLLKSTAKGEDDYRLIFENFVTDLLLTVNKPEWPAAELMLNVLGSILTKQLINKQSDQTTRVICIDYLGTVAATLRRDAVSSTTNEEDIDSVIKNLITGCKSSDEEDDDEDDKDTDEKKRRHSDLKKDKSLNSINKLQVLCDAILDYLSADKFDPSAKYARQFYFGQWFTDSLKEVKSLQDNQMIHNGQKNDDSCKYAANNDASIFQLAEDRRNHLLFKMFGTVAADNNKKSKMSRSQKLRNVSNSESNHPSKFTIQLKGSLDYEDACLVCRYLASLKPFSQSFDRYLTLICRLLSETSVAVRTKAMRCLSAVVEADPSILCRQDIEKSVHLRFLDPSTSVREAAVELVGKYLLTKPQLIPQYYPMIADRILDKGTSVRKRVIRIFRDICVEHTEFSKIPEICVKMIRRINDEEAIKKLVNEVFQNMWFSPVREKETVKLLQKVMNITDVVSAYTGIGFEWFDQLLESLLKKDESEKVKIVEKACKQIVDCLVQNIMRLEEISNHSNQRLVSCLATLHLFTKIRPELMVHHAMTLQPYLNIRMTNKNDMDILHHVARILEVTVPLIEHPSESYINQIEEDMVKLILNGSRMVLESCVACLASTVNKISHNYSLVKDCFERLFNCLLKFSLDKDINKVLNPQKIPMISRALFTVGLLCKYFDFNNLKLAKDINVKVFETLIFFAEDNTQSCDIRMKAISGVGFLCIRYRELLTSPYLSSFYYNILLNRIENVNDQYYPKLVGCILDNLSLFLIEEEERMRRMDSTWNNIEKKESLKEMGDMSSGISSHVAQKYLDAILSNVIQPWSDVRAKAVNLIVIIIRQGLINPIGSLPYLISAQTDPNAANRVKADNELAEIDKKFAGFISMKAGQGMKQSAIMQEILVMFENPEYQVNWCSNRSKSIPVVVRGVVDPSIEIPMALNHNLYSMLRVNKQYRRSFLYALLTIFGEVQSRLSLLIYVSDNLAQFSYQSQEEPLYLVHHIVIMVSSLGPNIIQQIHDQLFPELVAPEGTDPTNTIKKSDHILIEDEEDPNVLLQRMQNNRGSLKTVRECIRSSRGCILLVALKQYLRELYSLTDAKIQKFSPSDTGKAWERQLTRRSGVKFDPIYSLGLTEDAIVQENIYQKFASTNYEIDGIDLEDELYPNEGRVLIGKFLNLRQLVNALDPLDITGDSDEDIINNNHKSNKLLPQRLDVRDNSPCKDTGSLNGEVIPSMSTSHHSALIQGQTLRVEVDKLDLSSIPQFTSSINQRRVNTHKKTLVPRQPHISSDEDSDDPHKFKRSHLSITPNTRLLSKSSLGNRSNKKSKPKYHNLTRVKSSSQSENSSEDDNVDSDPDFIG